MATTRGRWLVLSLASLFVLVTLTFIPYQDDSAIARGFRASRELLSSQKALEHIYHAPVSSPEPPVPSAFPPFAETTNHDTTQSEDPPVYYQWVPPPPAEENESVHESHVEQPPPVGVPGSAPADLTHSPQPVGGPLTDPLRPPVAPVRPPVDQPVNSVSQAQPVEQATNVEDFRLLIGVMSPFWSSARRQIIRHAYSRFPKDLPVDIVFVEGNLSAPSNEEKIQSMQHTVIQWENSTYHDIMHLECRENLNQGKTYEFLKKVGSEFGNRYTHVMKTDDDAFVNIPGIYFLIYI
jgi:Galactosyltransferase